MSQSLQHEAESSDSGRVDLHTPDPGDVGDLSPVEFDGPPMHPMHALTNPMRITPAAAAAAATAVRHSHAPDEELRVVTPPATVVVSASGRTMQRLPMPMPMADAAGASSRPHSSTLTPFELLTPAWRLFVTCTLVGAAMSSLMVGVGGLDSVGCVDLAGFLLAQTAMAGAAIPIYHALSAEYCRSRSELYGDSQARLRAAAAALPMPAVVASRITLFCTLQWSLYALLFLSTLYSCFAVSWLSADGCASNRLLRQVALANVMCVLAMHVLIIVYKLIRVCMPKLYFRRLRHSAYKTIAAVICLAAFIANVAQLSTHDADGLEVYHWGFSQRPVPCPHDCLSPPPSPTNVRRAICMDSGGLSVDVAHCQHIPLYSEYHYDHPSAMNQMLQPCPTVNCRRDTPSINMTRRYTMPRETVRMRTLKAEDDTDQAISQSPVEDSSDVDADTKLNSVDADVDGQADTKLNSSDADVAGQADTNSTPSAPASSSPSDSSVPPPSSAVSLPPDSFPSHVGLPPPYLLPRSDPECPRECVSYPRGYSYPGYLDTFAITMGCWDEALFIAQRAAGVEQPDGWTDTTRCINIPTSSIVVCPPRPCAQFCGPLATASTLYAVVYALCILTLVFSLFYLRIAGSSCYGRLVGWIGLDTWAAIHQPNSNNESEPHAPIENALPEGATAEPHAATSMCHGLTLAVRSIRLHGCNLRDLKPWWRHILGLFGLIGLISLILYSLRNMFWLVEAHCRDFMLSAVLNAVLTFIGGIIVLASVCQRREQLIHQEQNPFETIGLISSHQADEAAFEQAMNEEEEEEDEFGLDSPTHMAARTRRELEMEPPCNL